MKIGLVFTNDWELFGNGSGDYHELQHRPLERLLEVFGNRGAKLTVMAEVGQQWAHQEVGKEQSWAREIAEAWESLLQDVVRQGHDVQLHLHPQWLNATYTGGKWELDYSQWAISSLSPETMESVLKKGRTYLESSLQPVNPDYECLAFRAGAYCIEPSQVVVQSLLQAGMVCDSSVTKGMRDDRFYDYRDAESNLWPWFANPLDIKHRNSKSEGLVEMPIYSYKVKYIDILPPAEHRYFQRMSRELFRRYPYATQPTLAISAGAAKSFGANQVDSTRPTIIASVKGRLPLPVKKALSKATMRSRWIQLNYDHMSAKSFIRAVANLSDSAQPKLVGQTDVIVPVVAAGHTKEMLSYENVEGILDGLDKTLGDRLVYWTLSDAARYWIKWCWSHRINPHA